jgi:hypothetical protein
MYTFGIHYSVPLLPFLFLALLDGLGNIGNKASSIASPKRGQFMVRVLILVLLLITVANSSLWRQVDPARYKALSTRAEVMALIGMIPPQASVAAQSALVPHIPKRKNIDMLPLGLGHDYIIVDGDVNLWPYTRPEFDLLLRDLDTGGRYTLLEKKGEARLYKRVPHP